MADNYTAILADGTTGTFGADDVSSALYPRIKLVHGADGAVTDTSAAAPLPVTPTPNTALAAAAVTVGTSEVALPTSALAARRTMVVYNNGSATIYLGPTGVTTASGLPVAVGGAFSVDLGPGVTLYAISGTAGQNVRVLEVS